MSPELSSSVDHLPCHVNSEDLAMPRHVAVIMDGNGRWGIKHKKSRNAGHKAGLKTVEKIIKETIKNKINRSEEHTSELQSQD